MTPTQPQGTRTRHVCLSCSLACSGVNQCVLCDAVIKQNVLAIALQRTGLSLEQANFFYQAYDDAFNWLHEQMLQDPRIDECSLDLSRVTIAPATSVPAQRAEPREAGRERGASPFPQAPPAPPAPRSRPAPQATPPSPPPVPPPAPPQDDPPMAFESEIRPDPEQVEMAQAALEQFEQAMQNPEFVAFMMSTIPGLQAKMQGQIIEAAEVSPSPAPQIQEVKARTDEAPAASQPRPERAMTLSTPIDADTIASAGVPIDIADIPEEHAPDQDERGTGSDKTPSADHLNGGTQES